MVANVISEKIDVLMCRLLKESNHNGKRGTINNKLHENMKKLTIVREFVKYWDKSQVHKTECWLRENFNL